MIKKINTENKYNTKIVELWTYQLLNLKISPIPLESSWQQDKQKSGI